MCDYGSKDTTYAWLSFFSILLHASNKVLSLQIECWQLQKAFSLSLFFCITFDTSPHNLSVVWDLSLKMRWFDRQGLRSSSLCFKSQEVNSTGFWLLERFYLTLTSRELSESGGASGKESPASAGDSGDMGLTPASGRCPGEGNSNPLQYSWLENSMNRGAWWATVHWVIKRHDWACTHTTEWVEFLMLTESNNWIRN